MKDGLLHAKTMGQKRDLHAYKKRKRELRATYFKNRAKCGAQVQKKANGFLIHGQFNSIEVSCLVH